MTHTELIARIYPAARKSEFVLYEDDGVTNGYRSGNFAQTTLAQQKLGNSVSVSIGATSGKYTYEDPNTGAKVSAPLARSNRIELVTPVQQTAAKVQFDSMAFRSRVLHLLRF